MSGYRILNQHEVISANDEISIPTNSDWISAASYVNQLAGNLIVRRKIIINEDHASRRQPDPSLAMTIIADSHGICDK